MTTTSAAFTAFELLQRNASAVCKLSNHEIERALQTDLESPAEVNEVLLTKFIRQAKLTDENLRGLIRKLQGAMTALVDNNPEQFLKYTKVQVILATELKKKANSLALVLAA